MTATFSFAKSCVFTLQTGWVHIWVEERPCIANDTPPNREVLAEGRAGVLVPVEDEERLYQEMLRMATDGDHAAALAQCAVNRVRAQYSIAAVANRYIELYDHLKQGSVT